MSFSYFWITLYFTSSRFTSTFRSFSSDVTSTSTFSHKSDLRGLLQPFTPSSVCTLQLVCPNRPPETWFKEGSRRVGRKGCGRSPQRNYLFHRLDESENNPHISKFWRNKIVNPFDVGQSTIGIVSITLFRPANCAGTDVCI